MGAAWCCQPWQQVRSSAARPGPWLHPCFCCCTVTLGLPASLRRWRVGGTHLPHKTGSPERLPAERPPCCRQGRALSKSGPICAPACLPAKMAGKQCQCSMHSRDSQAGAASTAHLLPQPETPMMIQTVGWLEPSSFGLARACNETLWGCHASAGGRRQMPTDRPPWRWPGGRAALLRAPPCSLHPPITLPMPAGLFVKPRALQRAGFRNIRVLSSGLPAANLKVRR